MLHKIIKSGLGGGCTLLIYIYLADQLDNKSDPRTANLIALLVSIAINFVIQCNIFLNLSCLNQVHLYKFLFVVCINIIINQLSFQYLANNKATFINYIPIQFQKYYNGIMRAIINGILFLVISYPTRHYWIFN